MSLGLVEILLIAVIILLLVLVILQVGIATKDSAKGALDGVGGDGGIAEVTSTAIGLKAIMNGFTENDEVDCEDLTTAFNKLKNAIAGAQDQGGINGEGPKWLNGKAMEQLQSEIDSLCD